MRARGLLLLILATIAGSGAAATGAFAVTSTAGATTGTLSAVEYARMNRFIDRIDALAARRISATRYDRRVKGLCGLISARTPLLRDEHVNCLLDDRYITVTEPLYVNSAICDPLVGCTADFDVRLAKVLSPLIANFEALNRIARARKLPAACRDVLVGPQVGLHQYQRMQRTDRHLVADMKADRSIRVTDDQQRLTTVYEAAARLSDEPRFSRIIACPYA